MAPSLLAAASPFLLHGAAGSSSNRRPLAAAPSRRAASALRVAALKYDPSKVAPQSDRVLVRLEQIPEKSAGGVLLPKSAVKFERYLMGEILSVGADVSEVEAGKKPATVFFQPKAKRHRYSEKQSRTCTDDGMSDCGGELADLSLAICSLLEDVLLTRK